MSRYSLSLSILVRKISVLEDLFAKTPVDQTAHEMLTEIRTDVKKMPSGSLLISEVYNCRKWVEILSHSMENPKPVTLNFKAKIYLVSIAAMVTIVTASLTIAKLVNRENGRLRL